MQNVQKRKMEVDPLKRPPHSVEAEQSIIGGLLLDNQVWEKINSKICPTDFYRSEHRVLYKAILTLVNKNQPFDVVTLLDILKSTNELDEAGGEVYLFELANNIPSITSVVLPIDGRPATIIKSAGCSPEVNSSRSLSPVDNPVTASPL